MFYIGKTKKPHVAKGHQYKPGSQHNIHQANRACQVQLFIIFQHYIHHVHVVLSNLISDNRGPYYLQNTFCILLIAFAHLFLSDCWFLFQQRFNPFPHIDASDASAAEVFLKTWRQKKKLLKSSNFSFFHHVFNYSITGIVSSFKGNFQFFSGMFSKSSAADLLYLGKGEQLNSSPHSYIVLIVCVARKWWGSLLIA